MCDVCGCDSGARPTLWNPKSSDPHEHVHADGTRHSHAHSHPHDHAHHAPVAGTVDLETRILAKNDALAERNRSWLRERGIGAVNLMGAPGAGKTALLERTLRDAGSGGRALLVIEGDQATANDAQRIRAAGGEVVQVNTGTGCHLDADMIAQALAELAPAAGALVVIENVGNLVCPALFDLGEARRVAVLSVTEGDDKPLKYPHMFAAADLMVLNKIDLLPHVDFDTARAAANARRVNPRIEVLEVSARTGAGMAAWREWLDAGYCLTAVSGASSDQRTPAGS